MRRPATRLATLPCLLLLPWALTACGDNPERATSGAELSLAAALTHEAEDALFTDLEGAYSQAVAAGLSAGAQQPADMGAYRVRVSAIVVRSLRERLTALGDAWQRPDAAQWKRELARLGWRDELRRKGRVARARTALSELRAEADASLLQARVLLLASKLLSEAGEHEEALVAWEDTAVAGAQIGHLKLSARAWRLAAVTAAERLDRPDLAARAHMREAEVWRLRGDLASEASAWARAGMMGEALLRRGRPAEALVVLRCSREGQAASRRGPDHASALAWEGMACMHVGDPARALALLDEARADFVSRDLPERVRGTDANRALVLSALGRHGEAAAVLRLVRDAFLAERRHDQAALATVHLAHSLMDLGQPTRALGELQAPSPLGAPPVLARDLALAQRAALGRALDATGRHAEASVALRSVLDAPDLAPGTAMDALVSLASAARSLGDWEETHRCLKAALEHALLLDAPTSDAGGLGLGAASRRRVNEVSAALLDEAWLRHERWPEARESASRDAFRAIEVTRSRTLLDRLGTSAPGDRLIAKQQTFRTAARGLRAAVAQGVGGSGLIVLRAARDRAEEELGLAMDFLRVERRIASASTQLAVPTAADVDIPLGEAEVLLLYRATSKALYGVAVVRGAVRMARIGDPAEVARLASQAVEGLAQSGALRDETSRALYALLLAPFEDLLAARTSLLVSPGPTLSRLPFECLTDGAGRPVVATQMVTYVPSATVLSMLRGRTDPDAIGAVLLGDPAYADPTLGLPATRAEVARVAGLLAIEQPEQLLGEAASSSGLRQAFARRKAPLRTLHLACHAERNEQSPLSGALLLARDDRLTVEEIQNLSFPARLVVLSACRSADGVESPGEGTVGLVWAFLVAGSRTVVASNWSVGDEATNVFMVEFYGRLVSGQTPALALATTKRMLREARVPMRDWAAFVAWGHP